MNALRLTLSALSLSLVCAAAPGCAEDADEAPASAAPQAVAHAGYGYEMLPAKVSAEAGLPSSPRPAEVQGRLPPEMIQGAVRDALPAVKACKSTPGGDLTARLVIEESGAVKSATTDKLHSVDTSTATCVRDVLASLQLPRSKGGEIEVFYQLDF